MPDQPLPQDAVSCRHAVRHLPRAWALVLGVLAAGCEAAPRGTSPPPSPARGSDEGRGEQAQPAARGIVAAPEPAAPEPEPDPGPQPDVFRVVADEFAVDPPRIRVRAGATVTITFAVRTERVYFGGIDFRSDVVDTDTILAGTERTITFTAPGRSFTFLAYWPATGVPKEARLEVEVD